MAKAPQQLGIGIRRRFTSAGTDPYDTVEWERRDSRIPNFKDGGDAFFQSDVEFPAPLLTPRVYRSITTIRSAIDELTGTT